MNDQGKGLAKVDDPGRLVFPMKHQLFGTFAALQGLVSEENRQRQRQHVVKEDPRQEAAEELRDHVGHDHEGSTKAKGKGALRWDLNLFSAAQAPEA